MENNDAVLCLEEDGPFGFSEIVFEEDGRSDWVFRALRLPPACQELYLQILHTRSAWFRKPYGRTRIVMSRRDWVELMDKALLFHGVGRFRRKLMGWVLVLSRWGL